MPVAGFSTSRRAIALIVVLGLANLLAWAWALVAFRGHAALIGTALLAWSYGLRHAVDADHIAAIDNVTRKLMQQDKQPVAVGAFFSLGHSTIVVLASIGIGIAAGQMTQRFHWFQSVGGTIGTTVSALFLLALALINLMIMKDVWKRFQQVKSGDGKQGYSPEEAFTGGVFSRLYGRLFGLVNHSWQMYLVGFLFGLGFDTATEVGLLGISAAGSSHGMSIIDIMVFPALFTVGMALIDSVDNLLMVKAYGWAFERPLRKLYYNLTITATSVVVALFIGGFEAMGLLADNLGWHSGFGAMIGAVNDNLGNVGFWVIGVMAACWLVSLANYHWRGYDRVVITD